MYVDKSLVTGVEDYVLVGVEIGVLSCTFVYIFAGLQVLMIWANCLFLLSCLFF